jgi:hypothetical protein
LYRHIEAIAKELLGQKKSLHYKTWLSYSHDPSKETVRQYIASSEKLASLYVDIKNETPAFKKEKCWQLIMNVDHEQFRNVLVEDLKLSGPDDPKLPTYESVKSNLRTFEDNTRNANDIRKKPKSGSLKQNDEQERDNDRPRAFTVRTPKENQCTACGRIGHSKKNCETPKECKYCGALGHLGIFCLISNEGDKPLSAEDIATRKKDNQRKREELAKKKRTREDRNERPDKGKHRGSRSDSDDSRPRDNHRGSNNRNEERRRDQERMDRSSDARDRGRERDRRQRDTSRDRDENRDSRRWNDRDR